jgi:nicotinamide-nucleotide amidase
MPNAPTDTDAEDPVAARVGDALHELDATLATAESCTGGLVGARVTRIPGASEYFEQGLVTYAYGAKEQRLGVSRELLDEHGAVSEPVARAMARGARDTSDVTFAVATTGIAGPSGGTAETPVGTVFVGVAYAAPWGTQDSFATVERYAFDGDRARVRERTVEEALADLEAAIERVRSADGDR